MRRPPQPGCGRCPWSQANRLTFPRPDQVSVRDSYQYDDGCEPCGNDTFNREPAIVWFHSPLTGTCPFKALVTPRAWSDVEVTQGNTPLGLACAPYPHPRG